MSESVMPPERVTVPAAEKSEDFKRSIGLVSNFSLGFTYLSPGAGVLSIFALGLATAGPPSIWWFPIVALGQLLVALVFGEVVSQYPITGGIYPGRGACGDAGTRGWLHGPI